MKAKYIFRHTKAEIIYHQNTCTVRNVKSPSGKGKFISNGRLELHKRMKSPGNNKYVDNNFSLIIEFL